MNSDLQQLTNVSALLFYQKQKIVNWNLFNLFFFFYFTVVVVIWGSGIGITAGAHRLWSHKSYTASLPLRILLIFLFTIAGQVWKLVSSLRKLSNNFCFYFSAMPIPGLWITEYIINSRKPKLIRIMPNVASFLLMLAGSSLHHIQRSKRNAKLLTCLIWRMMLLSCFNANGSFHYLPCVP